MTRKEQHLPDSYQKITQSIETLERTDKKIRTFSTSIADESHSVG